MKYLVMLIMLATIILAGDVAINTELSKVLEPDHRSFETAESWVIPGDASVVYKTYLNHSNKSELYLVFPNNTVAFTYLIKFNDLMLDYGGLSENAFSLFGLPQTIVANKDSIEFFSHNVEAAQQEFTPWQYPLLDGKYEVKITDVDFNDTYIEVNDQEKMLEVGKTDNLSESICIHVLEAVDGNSLIGEQDFTRFILTDMHFSLVKHGVMDWDVLFNLRDSDFEVRVNAEFYEDHLILKEISLDYITTQEYVIPVGSSILEEYNHSFFNDMVDYRFNETGNVSSIILEAEHTGQGLLLDSEQFRIPLFYQGNRIGMGSSESSRLIASRGTDVKAGSYILVDNKDVVLFEGCINDTPSFSLDGKQYDMNKCCSYEVSCPQNSVVFSRLGNQGDDMIQMGNVSLRFGLEGEIGYLVITQEGYKNESLRLDYYPYYGIKSIRDGNKAFMKKSNNELNVETGYSDFGSYVVVNGSRALFNIPSHPLVFDIGFDAAEISIDQYIESCDNNCYLCSNKPDCINGTFKQDCLWSENRCYAVDLDKYKEVPKIKPKQKDRVINTWNTTSSAKNFTTDEEEKMDLTTTAKVMRFLGIMLGIVIFVIFGVYFLLTLIKKRAEKKQFKEFLSADIKAENTIKEKENLEAEKKVLDVKK